LKAYATATTVVSKIVAADTSSSLLAYGPKCILRALFTASSVFLRVLKSEYSQYVDYEAGAALFNSALLSLRRCSLQENDMALRAADILGQLWRLTTNTQEEPRPIFQSRLGASLMFDTLWDWRARVCSRPNATGANAGTEPNSEGVPLQRNPNGGHVEPVTQQQQLMGPDSVAINWDYFDDLSFIWNFEGTESTIC